MLQLLQLTLIVVGWESRDDVGSSPLFGVHGTEMARTSRECNIITMRQTSGSCRAQVGNGP